MIKSIFKEIIIMLLLFVAILLVLGVLFYDYIPTNKIVPNKISAYKTPENVTEEIGEQITEFEKTDVVYEITDADLNVFKQSKSYNPGKPDPFSLDGTSENKTTQNTNETDQNKTSENNQENGNKNTQSQGSNSDNNNNNTNNNTNATSTNENNSSNTNENKVNNNDKSNESGTFFNNTGLK